MSDQHPEPSLIATVGRSYFPIAFFARMPYAMVVIGVLTLVVAGRGSLALGGVNSAMVGAGTALFGSLIGAAADRWGQRPVLLAVGFVNCLALIYLSWVVYSPLPDWAVLAGAFAIGASAPQVAPLSRSRLVDIILARISQQRRPRTLNITMAYESAADEVVFVFGPFLVGLLATWFSPVAPLIGAVAMTVVFITAFALHPSGSLVASGSGEGAIASDPASALFRPTLLVLLLGVFGVGLVFGSTLTGLTSLMNDFGRPEEAGLVYGVLGIGSALLAISVALYSPRFALWARWLVFAPVLLTGSLVLASSESMPIVIIALLLMGCAIGPTLVTLFSLVAERSPRGRSATAMSMAGSAIIVGQSLASAINGLLAEDIGTQASLTVPAAAAAIVLAAGLLNLLAVRRRDPEMTSEGRKRDVLHADVPIDGIKNPSSDPM